MAQQFTHVHSVRLSLIAENAPELAPDLSPVLMPEEEWADVHDPARIERMLTASAEVVSEALQGRIRTGHEPS
ncbi:hypothetical protein [Deinococcus apachensis]|uniref:hypothetical protein n=1 Tax=Deinococcus apachensis TaxID=309886 RepID=UPI00039BD555|nr:hypothetical protein [Deinococcus apachensis]